MFGESKLNLVLVVGAVLVILIGWQFLMPLILPTPTPAPPRAVTVESQEARPGVGETLAGVDGVAVDPAVAEETVDQVAAIAASRRINT